MENSKIIPDSQKIDNKLSISNQSTSSLEFEASSTPQAFQANPVDLNQSLKEQVKLEEMKHKEKEGTDFPSSKVHIQVHLQESLSQENQGFQFSSEPLSNRTTHFLNSPTKVSEFSKKIENQSSSNSNLSYGSHSKTSSFYTSLRLLGLFGIVAAIGIIVYFALTFSNQVTQTQIQASIQAILREAQRLADQNDPQAALMAVEEGLEKHPSNQNLLKQKSYYEDEVEISKILSEAKSKEQNDPSQALATLASGLTLFPESSSLKTAQSTLKANLKSDALEAATHYEEAQNFDRAMAVLDQATELIGEDTDLNARKQLDHQKAQEKIQSQQIQQANNQIKVAQNQTQTVSPSPTPSTSSNSPQSVNNDSSFVLPNSATQLYSYEQLGQTIHSQADLELAINEIYARNGRSFDTPKYKSYFEAQNWYTPFYSSSAFDAQRDTLLTPIELQNIETLVAYGQNHGWRE